MKFILPVIISFLVISSYGQNQNLDYSYFSEASIIGLGEESHGIKTINEQRNQLTFDLAEKYKVKFIVWEESFADLYRVNKLLAEKDPNYDQILKYFTWFWQTDETLALLKFIHDHNLKNQKKPIVLLGMDLSTHLSSYQNTVDFFEGIIEDQTILKEYASFEEKFRTYKRLKKRENIKLIHIASSLLAEIETNKSSYTSVYDHYEMELMKLNLSNIKTSASYFRRKKDSRDLTMFNNVNAIYSLCKADEKLIIYAHNGHLSKRDDYDYEKTTGFYLDEKFKEKYYALGFEFGQGEYLCATSSIGIARTLFTAFVLKKSVRKFMSSKTKSIPFNQNSEILTHLNDLNQNNLLINLSSLDPKNKLYELLHTPQLYHNIGGGCTKLEDAFLNRKWSDKFDGIFYIKEVEATNASF